MTDLAGIMLISVGSLVAFLGIVGVALAASTGITGLGRATTSTDMAPLTRALAWWAKTLAIAIFCIGVISLGVLLAYYGIVLRLDGAGVSPEPGI